MNEPIRATATHACPGCRRSVVAEKFACGWCWRRLSGDMRRAIWDTYQIDRIGHLRAMKRAHTWFRDNPLTTTRTP